MENILSSAPLQNLLEQVGNTAKADPTAHMPGEVLNAFGDVLKEHLAEVNQLQSTAHQASQTYAVGGPIELHQVMVLTEKAELALELTTQIRNKMVQAYQEISRMNV